MQAFWVCEKQETEGIVASTLLRVRDIPNSNVLLCLDEEDIAYVTSINHTPKVWTIHIPSYEWAQCDCPLAKQRIAMS
jgi:hypothetical protein